MTGAGGQGQSCSTGRSSPGIGLLPGHRQGCGLVSVGPTAVGNLSCRGCEAGKGCKTPGQAVQRLLPCQLARVSLGAGGVQVYQSLGLGLDGVNLELHLSWGCKEAAKSWSGLCKDFSLSGL